MMDPSRPASAIALRTPGSRETRFGDPRPDPLPLRLFDLEKRRARIDPRRVHHNVHRAKPIQRRPQDSLDVHLFGCHPPGTPATAFPARAPTSHGPSHWPRSDRRSRHPRRRPPIPWRSRRPGRRPRHSLPPLSHRARTGSPKAGDPSRRQTSSGRIRTSVARVVHQFLVFFHLFQCTLSRSRVVRFPDRILPTQLLRERRPARLADVEFPCPRSLSART
jgi:hypothetical protein